jgi:hypothetical protein
MQEDSQAVTSPVEPARTARRGRFDALRGEPPYDPPTSIVFVISGRQGG